MDGFFFSSEYNKNVGIFNVYDSCLYFSDYIMIVF